MTTMTTTTTTKKSNKNKQKAIVCIQFSGPLNKSWCCCCFFFFFFALALWFTNTRLRNDIMNTISNADCEASHTKRHMKHMFRLPLLWYLEWNANAEQNRRNWTKHMCKIGVVNFRIRYFPAFFLSVHSHISLTKLRLRLHSLRKCAGMTMINTCAKRIENGVFPRLYYSYPVNTNIVYMYLICQIDANTYTRAHMQRHWTKNVYIYDVEMNDTEYGLCINACGWVRR